MTSLMPRSHLRSSRPGEGPAGGPGRRPLAAVATAGGIGAALAAMLLTGCLGVIGWFLTDSGAHGTAGDGLRVGALAWLVGLGSGVHVQGAALTAIPLGLTLVAAVVQARVAARVGEAVSGHGPDADGLADGERDWTVPVATGLFGLGYLVTAVVTASVAAGVAGVDVAPDVRRLVLVTVLLCAGVGGTAIAIGSGRAAVWSALAPPALRAAVDLARRLLLAWLAVAALGFAAAFVVDLGTAANIVSQLHAGAGDVLVLVVISAAVLPNAVLFSSAYLLGPGFAVGAGTVVAPSGVVLGPLPMFPMLAALPDAGTPPLWVGALQLLAPCVALVVTWRALRAVPLRGYEDAALRGCGGGLLAAVGLALLTAFAGGAVGPGRMQHVAPATGEVLFHAVVALGLGALVGAVLACWGQRRGQGTSAHPAGPQRWA